MTAKDVKLALKQKQGTQYLVARYKLNSYDQLFALIEKLMPNEAARIIPELKKNQRKLDKKPQTSVQAEQKAPAPQKKATLQELQEKEKEESERLKQLEEDYKRICIAKKDIDFQIKEEGYNLQELQRRLDLQKAVMASVIAECERICQEKLRTEKRISQVRKELEELNEEIEKLRVIVVFFYADGTIELENGEIPTIDEKEVQKGVGKLLELEEAEKFTVRVLKAFVKLSKMLKNYRSQHIHYELIFDDSKAEQFWKTTVSNVL